MKLLPRVAQKGGPAEHVSNFSYQTVRPQDPECLVRLNPAEGVKSSDFKKGTCSNTRDKGQDAAQVAVLWRMVSNLRIGTEIAVCPIVREPCGLALSSRNVYLNAEQRRQVLALSRPLRHVEDLPNAIARPRALIEAAWGVFAAELAIHVD